MQESQNTDGIATWRFSQKAEIQEQLYLLCRRRKGDAQVKCRVLYVQIGGKILLISCQGCQLKGVGLSVYVLPSPNKISVKLNTE